MPSTTTPLHTRKLQFDGEPATLAADAPLPVTIATSAPVSRDGTGEILDCSPSGVDLSRAPLPLIVGHDQSALAVGVVSDLQAHGDRLSGLAHFGTSPQAQQLRDDVVAGIHRNVSVGYLLIEPINRSANGVVYRWQPHEVSIVSVPADPGARFFRSLSGVLPMPATTLQTRDADEITALCRRHSIPDFASGLLTRDGLTMDGARTAILEELARRDEGAGGHLNVRSNIGGSDGERTAIINTLAARMGVRDAGPSIRSADCLGLAVRTLALAGQRVSDQDSRDRILVRAMTTSDFPVMLGDAVGRVLHQAYEAAPAALRAVARKVTLPDFRARQIIRLGNAPSLERVNEHGEFKYGAISESDTAWRLSTYGRIVSLTRQAIVNDDLSGFGDVVTRFGQAAARREAEELVAVLLAPSAVNGTALFAANRSTLIDEALDADGLGAAVRALRSQKDADGGLITQEPGALVVPAALEMKARQLLASFTPATAGDVQPFKMDLIVEPRLDAAGPGTWYLVARNQGALEYGYLEGAEGVQTMQREGFEVDGIEIKARLDFGCGWAAPIGWVKSTSV